ncbi:MAG: hypothetical protein Q7T80_05370 [Methanoregula sp.]|nr:hypothetical protein [Methanoregula sp.]
MNPHLQKIAFLSSVFIALLLMVTPTAATYVLTGVSYVPNPPLVIGGQQQVTAMYYIGPSGSTTFIRGHELQMQTALTNARWNIQVIQNGRNAAQQSVSGSAAFVNGEILSYPNSNDITLSVTVDGAVPQSPGEQVMLLQVEEIDNSNNIVPGSIITISQPVAGQPVTAAPAVLPTLTPTVLPPLPTPTKSSGFLFPVVILAISLVVLILARRDS